MKTRYWKFWTWLREICRWRERALQAEDRVAKLERELHAKHSGRAHRGHHRNSL